MHPPHVVWRQTCRHRLHALAFSRQQQSRTIHLQWHCPIGVPRSLRQAIHICREALLLWAWRGVFAHKTSIRICSVYKHSSTSTTVFINVERNKRGNAKVG